MYTGRFVTAYFTWYDFNLRLILFTFRCGSGCGDGCGGGGGGGVRRCNAGGGCVVVFLDDDRSYSNACR